MKTQRSGFIVAGIVAVSVIATLSASAASRAADPAASAAIDADVLKLREAAWRAYFAGDEAALGAMLSSDFIGINMGDGPFVTRASALEEARDFRAAGGRLVSLEFPETLAQHYGDVVILYGRFAVVLETGGPESKTLTLRGRLTELFLRKGKGWIHTGWHVDTASTPRSTPSGTSAPQQGSGIEREDGAGGADRQPVRGSRRRGSNT